MPNINLLESLRMKLDGKEYNYSRGMELEKLCKTFQTKQSEGIKIYCEQKGADTVIQDLVFNPFIPLFKERKLYLLNPKRQMIKFNKFKHPYLTALLINRHEWINKYYYEHSEKLRRHLRQSETLLTILNKNEFTIINQELNARIQPKETHEITVCIDNMNKPIARIVC